jgi:energy-converting hydrogenase A subunit R
VKKVFISDCEGPISKNDNAFEITSHFVPNGDKLFTIISRYDDVLADIVKKPGYKAGDTLKLVLPFLKAYGVTDQAMREFSTRNLILISGAKDTLQYVRSVAEAFIVSTSYEHYMKALCRAINFPFKNVYCTRFSIDKYGMTENEKIELEQIAQEIARMPMFEVFQNVKSFEGLPHEAQNTIRRLDEFFCEKITNMESGQIYSEITPVGGSQKAVAIEDVAHKVDTTLADVMYVGDSITDEEAFRLVSKNGGLTVSFNGNHYTVENADIAVLSENSFATAIIADIFLRLDKKETLHLAENWSRQTLEESPVSKSLLNRFFQLHPNELPKVKIVTSKNMEELAKESSEFRKKVRGEVVGRLG